ncbi:MAG TPA: ABC transporter ATP-binding protein [Acidimicrobiia bacterium]|nr:ABC transporter ATP-binding protein [Acidimicrobiia bacterium]
MLHGYGWHSYLGYDETRERPEIDRALLRRVWGYGRPYRGLLLGTLATVLAISGFSVVPALLTRGIIDRAIPERNIGLLSLFGLGMVLVPVVSALIGVLQRWWSSRAGEGIIYDLRCQLYDHLQSMSLRFFTNTRTGELISRVSTDVVGAQQAITGTFITITSNLVSVVVTAAVMFQAEWRLTVLALLAMPLFTLPARRVARILRRITNEQMEKNAAMSTILQETFNVSGALLVKLFGRGERELRRYAREAAQARDLGVRRALVGRWFFAALGLVAAVGSAALFWVGGRMVIAGELTLGTVVMFATLLTQLYGPLSALTNSRVELATSLVSFERVFEVLDLKAEVDQGTVALPALAGEIEFENVYFRYQTSEPAGLEAVRRSGRKGTIEEGLVPQQVSSREWALEGVSFRIRPGELVALVGPSGAGKTTVSYLIPRLYDVDRGDIKIDGHNVRELTFDSIARGIGVVTQETYLFHDTIAANLRYAREDATLKEIEAAARAANIHEFIDSLPDRYETYVGERGYRLSGGERQRIAIARVILKDPAVLILDEATSHLDSRSEALIQDALERLMVGRTSVVIAHRLSTILAADAILVLDQGRLIEQGSHSELLAHGGLYAELFETQFRRVNELGLDTGDLSGVFAP